MLVRKLNQIPAISLLFQVGCATHIAGCETHKEGRATHIDGCATHIAGCATHIFHNKNKANSVIF